MTETRRRGLRGSAAALGLLALAWLLIVLGTTSYAIDDTYIHLQFARNLASGNGLSFHPQDGPVYGFTSPIWVGLLTGLRLAGVTGLFAARLLSTFSAAAGLLLLYRLSLRFLPPKAAPLPVIMLALNPWWIRWGASGMEACLAAAAAILVVEMYFADRSPFGIGLAGGLGLLVRPELALLGPGIAAVCLARREHRRAALVACGYLIPAMAWAVFTGLYFGALIPATAAAKADPAALQNYLAASMGRILAALSASDLPALLAVGGVLIWKLSTGLRIGRIAREWSVLALVPASVVLVLILGRAEIVSRYLLPVWPVLLVAAVKAFWLLANRIGRLSAPMGTWLLGAGSLCWQLGVLGVLFLPHMGKMEDNLQTYRHTAAYIREHTPPNALIAVQEIGVFGYLGERRLLDLGGLVSRGVSDVSFPGLDRDLVKSIQFLRDRGATHYMDPNDVVRLAEGLSERTGARFLPLESWVYEGGTSLASRNTYTRVLYRIDWLVEGTYGRSIFPTGAR